MKIAYMMCGETESHFSKALPLTFATLFYVVFHILSEDVYLLSDRPAKT